MPNIELFNDNWKFTIGEAESRPVRVPHDWLICDANNLYKSDLGIYTRELDASFLEPGQRLYIRFDGVYMDSALFVNGQKAGEWKYGYTTFEFEITDFIDSSKINELRMEVNFDGASARWYTGAGIYRDVHIITRNACHFTSDGIYITTSRKDGVWSWEAEAEVVTDGRAYDVKHTLIDCCKIGATSNCCDNGINTSSYDGESYTGVIEAWDIDNPRLYTVRSELIVDGKVEDSVDTRIGFRETRFDCNEGFFLNGRNLKLNGVCNHHDLGSLGSAFHKDAARRQLKIMREMGVNAIRTAHNPPATGLMDLCDEMGFVVMSELTDIWLNPKTPGDYARFFDKWVEKDAAAWIRRDRNRPSVILWSIGNEINDTHVDAEGGAKTLRRLLDLVKKHDPKVNAPPTLCSNFMSGENTQKMIDMFKIIGYNYNENLYELHHKQNPEWVIYGGETCSTLQSRGIYHFPLSHGLLANDDLQCSSLGNCTTSWGAKKVESCIHDDFVSPFSIGQFVWSGIDYLGEPTPYSTKNCYFGQADTAGFAKDSYFIFKSAWTDYKKAPFVHVFPYWDFSPGQVIDVRVCSNAPSIALFFNGELISKADIKNKWITSFQLPYNEGTLRAEAYDESGNVVATSQRSSFGDAKTIKSETSTFGELDFIAFSVVDEKGNPVENATNRIKVSVQNGELLTLDNGDSSDYESYHADNRKLFSGKLLAIVRRVDGCEPIVKAEFIDNDIPIRKIELAACDCKDNDFIVKATIYPANASHNQLKWRLTDVAGVDSPLGELIVSVDGISITVKPKGDGVCYVRCTANNGREHATVISTFKIDISGIGDAFLNPYSFISASLYSDYNIEPEVGIERGIATMRNRELFDRTMHIGYANLDFGSFGSDEIKLWLFPQESEPFDFEIWEGMPDKGGEIIDTIHYDKGSIWDKYIEAVYKLPRRLRGVKDISFAFHNIVQIKGFEFTQPDKAFAKLYAAENDGLYGDAFEINGHCVENIGNNVAIVFDDMDFGEKGTESLLITWRSTLPENAIRIDFACEKETATEMIAVPSSDNYSEKEVKLSKRIHGTNKVTLMFLPGSKIDIESIKFIL